jgi:dethiobiotin synthetase/adenosylmethionine--8-amino-7-oxononanoate aminotransferase
LQLWDGTLVNQLSSLPNVRRVVSLGTLCAIELKAEGSDAGYDTLYLLDWWFIRILPHTYFVE